MDLSKVIRAQLVTEKAYLLQSESQPKYTFVVDPKATKHHIALAFESIFGLVPASINTLLRKPKPTRYIKNKKRGYTKITKLAYITLPKGMKLELDTGLETNDPTEKASSKKGTE